MSTLDTLEAGTPPSTTGATRDWTLIVSLAAGFVAVADLVFLVLIGEVVPILAAAAVLTAIGIIVMQARRRTGLAVLGVTSAVMLVGGLPFAIDHLAHPESGVDWAHAVIGTLGRLVVLVLIVGAWRSWAAQHARLAGVVALGLLGIVATVGLIATAVTGGDTRQPGDVELVIDATAFPDQIVVESGDVLFVDNQHIFRHNFTVEGTGIDVELPALQAVRIPIDLPPGSYEVLCDIPGHEDMTSTLVVE